MYNEAVAAQIKDLILQLFPNGGSHRVDEWKTSMSPIEFGVLSWTLGAVYWSEV